MKIAVLFDGGGLARLGLENAGHECTGIELNPVAHYLSKFVGSGNSILGDARDFDISPYDAVWASPPCQFYTGAINRKLVIKYTPYQDGTLLPWALNIKKDILWVENVNPLHSNKSEWGTLYNAAQFLEVPTQNRNRIIGGSFKAPEVYHPYKIVFKGICPCITGSEYRYSKVRRASRFYGRKLTLEEAAYHQGFIIPEGWYNKPEFYTGSQIAWVKELYKAIGNGVPVYMAEAFGKVYN